MFEQSEYLNAHTATKCVFNPFPIVHCEKSRDEMLLERVRPLNKRDEIKQNQRMALKRPVRCMSKDFFCKRRRAVNLEFARPQVQMNLKFCSPSAARLFPVLLPQTILMF